ncbi:hypothetical protein [Klenkia sp. PcliD-1-E]|uniref:hypothetical protein n=1 Tax=Klenkia sp. PcliD-1-E TaxID=2954492 RepID=UPI0020973D7E|nr:hypothetical protein [Klenkia sp. PcliD-1-E]MCO7222517.1 hypothetical protein [Klenkia sp. PcliD-1-E]
MTAPVAGGFDVVDRGAGRVAAGGVLDERGADLLHGVALALQGRGHRRIEVDLAGVRAASAVGVRMLDATRRALTAELVLLHAETVLPAPGVRPPPPG